MNFAPINPLLARMGVEAAMLIAFVLVVGGAFFWLAAYVWSRPGITWAGRIGAVLIALLGAFCLVIAYVFTACASQPVL